MFWGCGSPVSWRTVPGTPGSPPTLGKTNGPIYTTLQMKGLWEFNINVWFPCMYSQKWNCYFQNRIIMFCLPVPTLIYLWEIYIFPGSVFLFCCREICSPILRIYKLLPTHECGNWDWGRAIHRKGIYKWDFPCSVELHPLQKTAKIRWAPWLKHTSWNIIASTSKGITVFHQLGQAKWRNVSWV